MESAKIILRCALAAIIYGIIHDQIATRICLDYFTVALPPIFGTSSPTFIGLAWGVVGSWWVGGILGCLIAFSARLATRGRLSAPQVVPFVTWLVAAMAACTLISGVIGYYKGIMPKQYFDVIPIPEQHRFVAVLWANNAAYLSGIFGSLAVCIIVIVKRIRSAA